jgi:phospho-N-acetylmuramoyl-pentapeptide-transferase
VTALLVAGSMALVISLVGTPVFIRWLEARGIGQQIREDGPEGHVTKAGTPTMGGVMIVAGAVGGYLIAHLLEGAIFTRGGLLVAFAVAGAGLVGVIDDWIKVRHQRSLGLTKRTKMVGQTLVAGGFAVLAIEWAGVKSELGFTRFDSLGFDPSHVGWMAWAVLVVIATSNAVNLTDGLDGLAAGSSTFAFSAFAIIGFWQFRHFDVYEVPQSLDLAVAAISLTGACAGFLWWNAAPARIFMGDTGSLSIGAGLAALALVMKLDLLLPVVGGLYVLETVSVIVQVASFRLFGRRVLRMAPLHHHFELLGWPETTVIVRFWILSGLCTALALGIFYADFISLGGLD